MTMTSCCSFTSASFPRACVGSRTLSAAASHPHTIAGTRCPRCSPHCVCASASTHCGVCVLRRTLLGELDRVYGWAAAEVSEMACLERWRDGRNCAGGELQQDSPEREHEDEGEEEGNGHHDTTPSPFPLCTPSPTRTFRGFSTHRRHRKSCTLWLGEGCGEGDGKNSRRSFPPCSLAVSVATDGTLF
ncbi:hypothetical protein B0H11DRAFT_2076967 [Mycena galericulata]|nr:hypothetical protein B0H11DRAFT_2076967 [Mycena galericulata]